MNNLNNLTSYEGTESLQINLSDKELQDYLELKLQTAKKNVEFIEKHKLLPKDGNVIEVGGGNGKLLYALELKGYMEEAVNYEVSKSRCNLANKFKGLLHSKKVKTINLNFLEDCVKENSVDLIIGVDIVYQLVAPLYDEAEDKMITWFSNVLKPNGTLMLELIDYEKEIEAIRNNCGVIKGWEEFPEADPYRYMLHKNHVDSDGNLVAEKTFIKRDDGSINTKVDVIMPISPNYISNILTKRGFDVEIYSNIDEIDLEFETLVNQYRVIARKVS